MGSSLRELSGSIVRGLNANSDNTAGCDPSPLLGDYGPGSPCRDGRRRKSTSRSEEDGHLSPGPASRFRPENPILNSSRPRRTSTVFVPLSGAVSEVFSFPHYPDCAHCGSLLRATEARWGYGLCDGCYSDCEKTCKICKRNLAARQLRWGSGLCNDCYDACEKTCQFCNKRLEFRQMHWCTGLCDSCYDSSDKHCRLCSTWLEKKQLHWRSGLCDPCYDSCAKICRVCQSRLAPGHLRWGTGLCDSCFDRCERDCRICENGLQFDQLHWQSGLCDGCYDNVGKQCMRCTVALPLGELHWRSGLCNKCYDHSEKNCKKCKKLLSLTDLQWDSGLCNSCYGDVDKTCQLCKKRIADGQLHWGTGLCDSCWSSSAKECKCGSRLGLGQLRWGTGLCDTCYDATEKICKICETRLQFGSLRWGTGLCDDCYDSCEKVCGKCKVQLGLGHLRWGTGLCDLCYDSCDKTCRICNDKLAFGQLRWATGYCDKCYDDGIKRQASRREYSGLGVDIWAAIVVQLVFYMAPALLVPALFLEIQGIAGEADAAAGYAAVLTTASVVAMAAPVPLGCWAERQGERQVYVGVTLAAAICGPVLGYCTNMVFFAIAWGVLNAPPAIRGVRAVLFAKNVKPEDLSRAGQLASSAGLLGSVVGPVAATVIQRAFSFPGAWFTGFQVCAFLATAAHAGSAIVLYLFLQAPAARKGELKTVDFRGCASTQEKCEKCERTLNEEESRYRSYLCNKCYDSFGGMGFKTYKWNILLKFCVVSALLELSMNAGVLATFQPIAVVRLGWGSNELAGVNFLSSLLSVIVSLVSAQLRLPEGCQVCTAAGLYCAGVILFTLPPPSTLTCIAGLVFGLKAQILFMAPFTSIFSRLIGRTRVTNRLTIALCLAPAVGGAVGTSLSPFFIRLCGTCWFMTSSLPAMSAFIFLLRFLKRMDGSW